MVKVCNQEVNGNYLGVFFMYVGIISVFKRVKLVIGCIRSQILRGYLCEIVYMNVDAPVENKCDDTNDII